MGISMIDVLSSCLVLPWEQRNPFVRGPCSFSSQSNFATFRTSFSTSLSKGNVNPLAHLSLSLSTSHLPPPLPYVIYMVKHLCLAVEKLERKRTYNIKLKI
jgi:hypothetical protein